MNEKILMGLPANKNRRPFSTILRRCDPVVYDPKDIIARAFEISFQEKGEMHMWSPATKVFDGQPGGI
jgi:hypothetical protein